jgi:hypothetical protein
MNKKFALLLASQCDATNFHHGQQFSLQLARFVLTLSFTILYTSLLAE